MWKFSWILQSDWISRNFLIKIWTMWPNLRRVAAGAAAAGQTLGPAWACHSVSALWLRCCKANLLFVFKLVKKGYKTNIPSFYFERIVEITYLRRTGNFSIFPRGFAPRKNRNMPVLLRYIISTILSQSLVYLYIISLLWIFMSILRTWLVNCCSQSKEYFSHQSKKRWIFFDILSWQHCACSIMLSSSWALLRMLTNA